MKTKTEIAIETIEEKNMFRSYKYWMERGFDKEIACWLEGYSIAWRKARRLRKIKIKD